MRMAHQEDHDDKFHNDFQDDLFQDDVKTTFKISTLNCCKPQPEDDDLPESKGGANNILANKLWPAGGPPTGGLRAVGEDECATLAATTLQDLRRAGDLGSGASRTTINGSPAKHYPEHLKERLGSTSLEHVDRAK